MLKRKKNFNFNKKQLSFYASKGNQSPLNTNDFIIDRFKFEDKGDISELSYGSILGKKMPKCHFLNFFLILLFSQFLDEISIERIEEELLFLSSKKRRNSFTKHSRPFNRLLNFDDKMTGSATEDQSTMASWSQCYNQQLINDLMEKAEKQELEIFRLKQRLMVLENKN